MTFESWAAFTAASAVLLIIPGPTVLLVVSYALGQGWRTALPMAIGVALGDFTAMTLSLLGLGALLAASATLFTILKWVGAAYLVYLGVKLWRAGGALEAAPRTDAVSAAPHAGPCLAGDGAQPQEHHLLRGLPARLPRPACRLPHPDAGVRGDVPGAGLRQCLRLRAWSPPAPAASSPIPRAIGVINKVGGGLLIGAGAATVTLAGSRS